MRVSEISLGTWAFGSEWGSVSDDESYATLNRAIDLSVNFLDTADVYGDGRSERLIGRLLEDRPNDEILVATKAGRRLDPHTAEGYDYEHLSAFVERSLENLGVEPSTSSSSTARRPTRTGRTRRSRRWIGCKRRAR